MIRRLLVFAGTVLAASAVLVGVAEAVSAPSVSTDGVNHIGQNSAVLHGAVNPNGASTTYYFQWGLTTSYGASSAPRSAGHGVKTVSVERTATGLAPGTVYHYRLVATNEFGTTVGADRDFKTAGHPPPGAVTGGAGALSTAGATLVGVVYPGSSTTSWYFQWGTSTAYQYRTAPQTLAPSTSGRPVSFALTALAPGTIYHFRLVAVHSGSAAAYGADANFMTYPSPRPVPAVFASTRPHRARHRPYVFTTTGVVAGHPSIPNQYACNGNVTIRFFRGLRQVGFTLAGIQPNCTFSARTVFGRIPGGRRGPRPVGLRVVIRSIHNNYLGTNRAPIEHVKLG
jgi:hypothetical protein